VPGPLTGCVGAIGPVLTGGYGLIRRLWQSTWHSASEEGLDFTHQIVAGAGRVRRVETSENGNLCERSVKAKAMPIRTGKDAKGRFVRWGGHGAKYYFATPAQKLRALQKARRQAAAAHAHGYRGHRK
jgi:hypothetical protein